MTFSTISGHFKYYVMTLGLSHALSVFQCLINDVLRDILRFVIGYIDDILLYSLSPKTQVLHVRQVLERLL